MCLLKFCCYVKSNQQVAWHYYPINSTGTHSQSAVWQPAQLTKKLAVCYVHGNVVVYRLLILLWSTLHYQLFSRQIDVRQWGRFGFLYKVIIIVRNRISSNTLLLLSWISHYKCLYIFINVYKCFINYYKCLWIMLTMLRNVTI